MPNFLCVRLANTNWSTVRSILIIVAFFLLFSNLLITIIYWARYTIYVWNPNCGCRFCCCTSIYFSFIYVLKLNKKCCRWKLLSFYLLIFCLWLYWHIFTFTHWRIVWILNSFFFVDKETEIKLRTKKKKKTSFIV